VYGTPNPRSPLAANTVLPTGNKPTMLVLPYPLASIFTAAKSERLTQKQRN